MHADGCVVQGLALGGGEVGEGRLEPRVAAPDGLVDDRASGVGESDVHLAAVDLVGGAAEVAGLFEAVDGAVHRRRGDALAVGQLAEGVRTVRREGGEDGELPIAHRVDRALRPETAGQAEGRHAEVGCLAGGRHGGGVGPVGPVGVRVGVDLSGAHSFR